MSAERSAGGKQPEQKLTSIKVDIGADTLKVVDEMAAFTGIESSVSRKKIVEVLSNALDAYDWILEQQALGRTVASLGTHEVSQVVSSQPPTLDNFIPPEKRGKAREHYQKLVNERNNQEEQTVE